MDPGALVLTATQQRVLIALKRRGEATADELADALEISAGAVRQHMSALRAAGFITSRQERGQLGRPAERYRATHLSEPLFATELAGLSVELLEHIEDEDPQLVDRVFERRRRRLVEDARADLVDEPIHRRIDRLAELLDAQGYLAEAEKLSEDHYRIKLHSCAIWTVASRYEQACTAELEFLRQVIPEAVVERVTHKPSGAHTCGYDISLPE